MKLTLLVLYESIPGCCPKVPKLGRLPNHTHDPRIQVTLRALLKNDVEYKSGVVARGNVVQHQEQQSRKKYSK